MEVKECVWGRLGKMGRYSERAACCVRQKVFKKKREYKKQKNKSKNKDKSQWDVPSRVADHFLTILEATFQRVDVG